MPSYDDQIDKISNLTGTVFRPAANSDLTALQKLPLPKSIIDFYARHEPSECAEGQVRLWPITGILVENRDAIPGAYTAPHGYIVFASTFCGDAYCFDTNNLTDKNDEPQIVLISHEVISEEISASEVRRLVKPVAKNFREFLDRFIRQEIDEECIYGQT